ncbi:MAG TPA: hypothetical protein GX505_04945 [Clostridiales bacterium]|nr:hypothetical protein [Clostridiales bacterium]
MFTAKNRSTMQIVYRLTAIILAVLLLASCARNVPSSEDKPDDKGKPEVTVQPEDKGSDNSGQQQDKGSNAPGSPATAAESYSNFATAKGDVITMLSDALANNPDTALYSMSLLGVVMVDLAMLPASSFGLGQEAANTALGFLGLKDIEYTESGNQYSVKHTRDDGRKYELQGVYDKAADSLKCKAFLDGSHCLTYEYRKTSYGYVAQIFSIGDDGSAYVYKLAFSDRNGAVGMSEESAEPPALTGSETIDFPKQCPEWYAIDGDAVTGVTSDGKELSFVYTPSED